MAHDRERSRARKSRDVDASSTRFAEAAGEGVSGNTVVGLGLGRARGRTSPRRSDSGATSSAAATPGERAVDDDMTSKPGQAGAASNAAAPDDASSFYARAWQRRAGETQRASQSSRGAREEEIGPPSMQDIARGYGVDRNALYGSRSYYTLGGETDWSFRNRAESVSPHFGDNLGAGADSGSGGSDLGPGIGANRAYGYGAVPSFGGSSPRGSEMGAGYGVGHGPPGSNEERPTFRGRPVSESGRAETSRAQPRRASNQPFDRGSLFGTVNLPSTGTPDEAADRPARATRGSRWRREPLTARDIMTRDVRSVRPDASIRDAAKIMRDQSTGVVPVVADDDTLQGVVTDRDIVMRSIAEGTDPTQLTAADLMTRDIDAATPDEPLVDVIHLMGDKQIRRVPVVDQRDRLIGIISLADVATRADYDTDLQDALEEISLRRSFWRE